VKEVAAAAGSPARARYSGTPNRRNSIMSTAGDETVYGVLLGETAVDACDARRISFAAGAGACRGGASEFL
jgi:hypothetical protein